MTRARTRAALAIALIAVVSVALPGWAVAHHRQATTASVLVARDCQEEQAFVDGSDAVVARLLPKRYTAVRDPVTGAPVVFTRGLDCAAVTIGGHTGPAVVASFGVTVDTPDGTGCSSAAPVVGGDKGDAPPACNWYTLGWLTTSRSMVAWLRDAAPGLSVAFAPGLSFSIGDADPTAGGAPFRLTVPAATGTPFTMTATTRPRPGRLEVRGGYWHDSSQGNVKVVFAGFLTSGDATGRVTAPAHSTLARLLGATERSYLPGLSAVAAEHWDQAVYRPQLLDPAPQETSYAGSCSLQGTVHFTPGASNSPQHLHYDYRSTGTCSGALDGKQVDNVPVSWHSWGAADGTCASAMTPRPSDAIITFPHQRQLALNLDFTDTGTDSDFGIYGDRSGMAPGQGSFLTERSSPTVLTDCAGNGAVDVPMDLSVSTETPLVSAPASQE